MIDFYTLFKVIFSLLIVIGTLYGLLLFMKKYITPFNKTDVEDIKIRDVKFISKDIGFVSLEFDKKIILIAFDKKSIKKISEKVNQHEN